MSQEEKKHRARRRALRAAQVVTIGLALAAGGCYARHESGPPDAGSAEADAATSTEVGGSVGSTPGSVADAAVADAVADAAMGCTGAEDWAACCNALGWPCDGENDWGCCAWGPYAPPEEGAVPAPRIETQRVLA